MTHKSDQTVLDLAWCETVTSGALTPNHLRHLDRGESLRTGGGLTGEALCGRPLSQGWDVRQATTDDLLPLGSGVAEWRCQHCLAALSGA